MRIALRINLDGCPTDPCFGTEMSRGMQRIYDRIARRFSEGGTLRSSAAEIVPKLRAAVTVNGCEFSDPQQMPPEYRRFYEEILTRTMPMRRAVDIVVRAEHANFIKRTIALTVIAAGCAAAIVYLWLQGYYA